MPTKDKARARLAEWLTPRFVPIGYPADTLRGGAGNLAPFGFNPSVTTFDEARWQQIIPARLLPTAGGQVVGLAVNCQSCPPTR